MTARPRHRPGRRHQLSVVATGAGSGGGASWGNSQPPLPDQPVRDGSRTSPTPVAAVRRVVEKAGWPLDSVDLFEINEAFASQMVAVLGELGLDPARVNVNGGAVALGHPIGASGARILTTLLHAMVQRDVRRGVAALCLGGGNGVALAVERDAASA